VHTATNVAELVFAVVVVIDGEIGDMVAVITELLLLLLLL
jgi:hypothetical protein